jgi:TM2 domain-containing membrane protein YozV
MLRVGEEKKFLVIISLVFIAFFPYGAAARERTYNFDEPTPANAMMRSMILPGWGQFYNGQPLKGLLFAGVEIAAVGGAFVMYSKANTTYSDYETKRTDDLYTDYSKQIDTTNLFIYLAAAIWAGNILDAYLSADSGAGNMGPESEEESKSPGRGFYLQAKGTRQLGLSYRYTF